MYFTCLIHLNIRELNRFILCKSDNDLVCSKAVLIERLLKFVCTENIMIDETFQLLWPEGMVSDRDAVVAMRRLVT